MQQLFDCLFPTHHKTSPSVIHATTTTNFWWKGHHSHNSIVSIRPTPVPQVSETIFYTVKLINLIYNYAYGILNVITIAAAAVNIIHNCTLVDVFYTHEQYLK